MRRAEFPTRLLSSLWRGVQTEPRPPTGRPPLRSPPHAPQCNAPSHIYGEYHNPREPGPCLHIPFSKSASPGPAPKTGPPPSRQENPNATTVSTEPPHNLHPAPRPPLNRQNIVSAPPARRNQPFDAAQVWCGHCAGCPRLCLCAPRTGESPYSSAGCETLLPLQRRFITYSSTRPVTMKTAKSARA